MNPNNSTTPPQFVYAVFDSHTGDFVDTFINKDIADHSANWRNRFCADYNRFSVISFIQAN